MYKTTTRPRRRHLIREWKLLDRGDLSGTRGAILNIDRSPWDLADSVKTSTKFGESAREAISALERLDERGGPSQTEWRDIAPSNAAVPTVLRAIGRPVSQQLIFHSYTLSAVAMHIFVDVSLPKELPLPGELLDINQPELVFGIPNWYNPIDTGG